MTRITIAAILALACALSVNGQPDRGKDCDQTSTGMAPIDLMTADDLYQGKSGGLYPDGTNKPPAQHLADLKAEFLNLPPVVGFTSAGMSNCEMIWAGRRSPDPVDATSFMGKATPKSGVVLISGAQGTQDASRWLVDGRAWDEVPNRFARAGVSADEVIFCWAYHALRAPDGELPTIGETQAAISEFARQAKVKWPNLRVIYLSGGNYHGYATGDLAEPHSYETGWACKLTIAAQINQRSDGVEDNTSGDLRYWEGPGGEAPKAPIITWGPYLWRDGLPHWTCDDTVDDGVHPTLQAPGLGQDKWSDRLVSFFMESPTAGPWFNADWSDAMAGEYTCADGDINGDGRIDGADLLIVLANWDAGIPPGVDCKPRYDQTKQSGTDAALGAEMEARGWLPLPLLYEGRLWDGQDGKEPAGFDINRTAETLADIDHGSRILLDVEEWQWFMKEGATEAQREAFVASYVEMITFIRTVRPDLIIGAYQIPHTLLLNSERTWMFHDIMPHLDFSAPVFYPKFAGDDDPFDVDLATKHAQFDKIMEDYGHHGIPFYALGSPSYDSDPSNARVMREVPEEWKDDYVALWDRGEALIFFSNMGTANGQRTWPELETEEQQSATMRRWLEVIDAALCRDLNP